ncbi:MAG: hypothetical protein KY437_04490 [Actinobacteria bacterium]|nr:hypothetical protein [Actinomycetota bacterium]
MLTGDTRTETGLASVALVIVIAWALAAVLMLTGTLVAAQQIDGQVTVITNNVSEIDEDLDAIRLARRTNELAAGILTQVQPLDGQLDEVVASVDSIDGHVSSILTTAGSINGTARAINGTVGSIEGNVRAINRTVSDIHATFVGILDVVRSINCGGVGRGGIQSLAAQREVCGPNGIPGINNRLDAVIATAQAIRQDTSDILSQVTIDGSDIDQHGGPSDARIHGHANSIDCRVDGEHCDQ